MISLYSRVWTRWFISVCMGGCRVCYGLRNHRKYETVLWHAWIGAVLCPIVMSGIIEILQEYCTTYRGGDWFDFLANTCGVIAATAFAWFVLRPWIVKDLNS